MVGDDAADNLGGKLGLRLGERKGKVKDEVVGEQEGLQPAQSPSIRSDHIASSHPRHDPDYSKPTGSSQSQAEESTGRSLHRTQSGFSAHSGPINPDKAIGSHPIDKATKMESASFYINIEAQAQQNNNKSLSSFHTVYPPKHRDEPKRTRSVILVHKRITTGAWTAIPINHPDVSAIQVVGNFGTLRIYNIYTDCDHDDTLVALDGYMGSLSVHA
ncbi:hypothetical protein K435DRAFT_871008 [Dendrothele bispora CBS 962.96]|uniref:Uncharacterized protein n=1 Tax=Dendrothele bispora (strain CBS 962.96) TaxID=1314807 RepID=A0A4S8L6J4_DENBC|nr:hypothetical protein K435DRAFT_871008 [Dendrothele bispora CBS 962.96]